MRSLIIGSGPVPIGREADRLEADVRPNGMARPIETSTACPSAVRAVRERDDVRAVRPSSGLDAHGAHPRPDRHALALERLGDDRELRGWSRAQDARVRVDDA